MKLEAAVSATVTVPGSARISLHPAQSPTDRGRRSFRGSPHALGVRLVAFVWVERFMVKVSLASSIRSPITAT